MASPDRTQLMGPDHFAASLELHPLAAGLDPAADAAAAAAASGGGAAGTATRVDDDWLVPTTPSGAVHEQADAGGSPLATTTSGTAVVVSAIESDGGLECACCQHARPRDSIFCNICGERLTTPAIWASIVDTPREVARPYGPATVPTRIYSIPRSSSDIIDIDMPLAVAATPGASLACAKPSATGRWRNFPATFGFHQKMQGKCGVRPLASSIFRFKSQELWGNQGRQRCRPGPGQRGRACPGSLATDLRGLHPKQRPGVLRDVHARALDVLADRLLFRDGSDGIGGFARCENDGFCLNNDGFCIKNDEFCTTTRNCVSKDENFCINNDELCSKGHRCAVVC